MQLPKVGFAFAILSFLCFSPVAQAEIIYSNSAEFPEYSDDNYRDYGDYAQNNYDMNQAFQEPDATYTAPSTKRKKQATSRSKSKYAKSRSSNSYYSRLPSQISGHGEKVIVVDPRVHAWGAYNAQGELIKAGIASAGASWCPDLGRSCRTKSGTFRIFSLGSSSCYSRKFPLGRGGAPMPYCMYFNGGQGLHGSYELADRNMSHGCVRLRVSDAAWIRFNFATHGTKVIVRPY